MPVETLSLFCRCLAIASTIYWSIVIYLFNPIGLPSPASFIQAYLLFSGQLLLLILVWHLVQFAFHFYHRNNKHAVGGKAVLITGCDTGFGYQTARRLHQIGFKVFAGVLDVDGSGAVQLKECSERMRVIKLDVTDDGDIANAVKLMKKSGDQLWGVLNNAGILNGLGVEFGEGIEDAKMAFDINVFGALKLIKMCLPMLRKSKGRIVNVTSVAAYFASPFMFTYSMTKCALRSLTDNIRIEVEKFGVRVVSIEPGSHRTNIHLPAETATVETLAKTDSEVIAAYQEVGLDVEKYKRKSVEMANKLAKTNLDEVASAIEQALLNRYPKSAYRLTGFLERPIYWLMSTVPDDVFLWYSSTVINFLSKD